ncbi:MAG: 50S ribosomal protein L25, partial [Candidatus Melainabacteria bacterium]|nr:50S ribosomal protein L25 [Candidatus Melainabacteria bacterium]
PGKPSRTVQVPCREFIKLPPAAYSHLVELLDESVGSVNTIIRAVHRKPTTHEVLNIEFYEVQADRKVTVTVPIKFTGTSLAIQAGGQLIEDKLEAEIECLPHDIPDFLEVDLAQIVEMDQGIHFADLAPGSHIKILNPADEIVVRVITPRAAQPEEKVSEVQATPEATATATT